MKSRSRLRIPDALPVRVTPPVVLPVSCLLPYLYTTIYLYQYLPAALPMVLAYLLPPLHGELERRADRHGVISVAVEDGDLQGGCKTKLYRKEEKTSLVGKVEKIEKNKNVVKHHLEGAHTIERKSRAQRESHTCVRRRETDK